jgi:hypothetical protein
LLLVERLGQRLPGQVVHEVDDILPDGHMGLHEDIANLEVRLRQQLERMSDPRRGVERADMLEKLP